MSVLTLQEIGARLRFARLKGNKLTSPDCPCCGGHRKRYKTALSVIDRGDFLLLACFKCGADWKNIASALGIRADRVAENARDDGPFFPQEAVLANVVPWRFVLSDIDFPGDEVGRCARILHEYVPVARRATKRLKHDPDEAIYCVRFSKAAIRRAKREQFNDRTVEAACRLLREMFVTSDYRTKRRETDDTGKRIEKPLLFTVVHVLKLRGSGSSFQTYVTASATTESSCHSEASDEGIRPSLEVFLAELRPNPPPDEDDWKLACLAAVGL